MNTGARFHFSTITLLTFAFLHTPLWAWVDSWLDVSIRCGHTSWFNATISRTCLRYRDKPESFCHTILRCPAKPLARAHHLHDVSTLGPDTPLWSSFSLLLSPAAYIKATGTDYPLNMHVDLPSSSVSMVFPSSPFGFLPIYLLASPLCSLCKVFSFDGLVFLCLLRMVV